MGEGRMEREEGKRKQERKREKKGEINKLNILILI